MPAKAGIQNYLKTLDSRLRGNDAKGRIKTFYETINVDGFVKSRILPFNLFPAPSARGQALRGNDNNKINIK